MRKAWGRICDENYHRRRQMGAMEIDERNGVSGKKRAGNSDRKDMEPRIKSKKESNDKKSKQESRSKGARRKSAEIDVEKQWKVCESAGKTLLTYPPNSERSLVSLIAADVKTLDPKQLINDQVVDFWMQYLYKEKLSAKQRARSYVFSSYFFPSLRNRSNHQPSLLRNWMKNVNIFTKDFLFVPISLRSHWFLAVICFPHLNISREMLDTFVPETVNGNGETSASDEYSDDEDDIKQKSCILVFDSMKKYTTDHTLVFRTLWNFLTTEARRQNPQSAINFTAATMPASVVEVPQQPNKCDCALFLFKYFEAFFTSPIQSFEFPIASMKKWFSRTEVVDTRENIYKVILRLTCKHFPENLKEVPDLEYCKREMSGDEDSDEQS